MNFQLDVDLLMHYTWVSGKPLLLKIEFLFQSCWSNGQGGWLPQVKGSGFEFELLWVQKNFPKFILGKMFEKHSKLNLKIR
jgi:hypothetical protein